MPSGWPADRRPDDPLAVELETQQFQFAAYYVNPLISDAWTRCVPIADKKRIELVQSSSAPEDADVFCDSEAVHQILTQSARQRHQVHARRWHDHGAAARCRPAEPQRVEIFVATTASASPPRICRGCLSASTGWTRPAPASWAAPDWAWRSSSTWPAPRAGKCGWKAELTKAPRLLHPAGPGPGWRNADQFKTN